MEFLDQTTQRYDGTKFHSRRRPKLHVVKPDGTLHACTGVAHASVVLSDLLGDAITHGQITRRSVKLKELLTEKLVALRWPTSRWPEVPVSPPPSNSPDGS